MKHLKPYKIFESNNQSLQEISLDIDDMLLDISDEGFPYVQPSFIHKIGGEQLNIEINSVPENKIGEKFEIPQHVVSVLERISDYIEDTPYLIDIALYEIAKINQDIHVFYKGDGVWVNTERSQEISLLGMKVNFIGIKIYKI